MNNLDKLNFGSEQVVVLEITSEKGNQKGVLENITNYTVSTKEQLNQLASVVNGGNTLENKIIYQIKDIDLNDGKYTVNETAKTVTFTNAIQWNPIGTQINQFKGIYNGQNKTISGLYIDNSNTNDQGLFGVNNGTIQNIKLLNSKITGYNQVGGIAGSSIGATVTNCSVDKNTTITGNYIVGGIVGINRDGSKIQNCTNDSTINATGYQEGALVECVGGICGCNSINGENTISNCTNMGEISGKYWGIGGILGYDNGGNSVSNCVNKGSVNGTNSANGVGGVVGMVKNGSTVQYSYNEANVTNETSIGDSRAVRWSCRSSFSDWN